MQKILFHHIPKTAGSSLIAHATTYFGSAACPARYDFQLSDAMIESDALVFYHGHFTQEMVRHVLALRPDTFVFTFVRHPFSRTLSQYYNWTDRTRVRNELALVAERSEPSAHFLQLRQKFEESIFDMALADFLKSDDPDINQVVNNIQSQYLTTFETPDHVRFSRASANAMSSYDLVGIKELYAPCLRIVEARCGLPWEVLGGTERTNTNDQAKAAGKYQVRAEELAMLERRNVYDLALFHTCHAMLLKDYAEELPPDAFDPDVVNDLPVLLG